MKQFHPWVLGHLFVAAGPAAVSASDELPTVEGREGHADEKDGSTTLGGRFF